MVGLFITRRAGFRMQGWGGDTARSEESQRGFRRFGFDDPCARSGRVAAMSESTDALVVYRPGDRGSANWGACCVRRPARRGQGYGVARSQGRGLPPPRAAFMRVAPRLRAARFGQLLICRAPSRSYRCVE